jgi:hypothetical protein
MATYAKISNSVVVNIQVMSGTDYQDPSFTWDDITSVVPAPQIGWGYVSIGVYTNPALLDAYGNIVTFSTDGTYDYYAVPGYPTLKVATGTAQATALLALAKSENLTNSTGAIEAWTESQFSLGTQNAFRNLYTLAVLNGRTNRAAYCLQLMTWGQAVIAYAATYIAAVQALTSAATVATTVPDFTQVSVPVPAITPVGAMAITT